MLNWAVLTAVLAGGYAPPPQDTLTIVGGGDVLLHGSLHRQALAHPNGHQSLWWDVRPLLAEADIAYLNLEGPMAPGTVAGGGVATDPGHVFDGRVYASYPLFNYHTTLAADLADSGVDVVSTANNHALDRGARGVDLTLDALAQARVVSAGTRAQAAHSEHTKWGTVVTRGSWRVAFVACTEHTNGIADRLDQVALCFENEQEMMGAIAHWAETSTAVVVTPHWGAEYAARPNANQVRWANEAIRNGATLVWGAHAHVVQPWGVWRVPDGRQVGVAYSMGNFVSGQFHRQDTRAGLLMRATLVRRGRSSEVRTMQAVGLEMIRDGQGLRVRPFVDGEGGAHTGAILRDRTGTPLTAPLAP